MLMTLDDSLIHDSWSISWPGVSPTAILNEENALGTRLGRDFSFHDTLHDTREDKSEMSQDGVYFLLAASFICDDQLHFGHQDCRVKQNVFRLTLSVDEDSYGRAGFARAWGESTLLTVQCKLKLLVTFFLRLTRDRGVFHAINSIWLSVTFFRDESRKSESVPSIFVFCILGFGVIFRRSAF